MTPEEFSLHHHRLQLFLQLSQRTGKSFQDLFESIMQKHDPSFLPVKPMGREGDWKSDGASLTSGTHYQCYAPEKLTGPKAAEKVLEDFTGARAHWHDQMRAWVFVWSSYTAIPPQVVKVIAELKAGHTDIAIDTMGREGLWEIVRKLSQTDRDELLGIVPVVERIAEITAAELQVLMKHLAKRGGEILDDPNFDLTAISEKLTRNQLSWGTTYTVRTAIPVGRLVRQYVTNMPDPDFSQAIANDLGFKYRALVTSENEPDVVFGGLVDYVLGDQRGDPRLYWAAAGIITYYFELCDVFER